MATYKVPQDVEAEDKLLGPFSFRQFIYLIVAALAGFLAFGLSRLFIGLVVIPLPVMLFFLILALPLKKDQPMETYLTAIVRFWIKPRLRLWDPEGSLTNVEITVPTTAEEHLTKEYSGQEASERLRYLSQIVDTGGWSTRGLTSATDNPHLSDTLLAEAQTAEDMLDDSAGVAQTFDSMISKADASYKDTLMATMQASTVPATPPASQAATEDPSPSPTIQEPATQPTSAPQPPQEAAPTPDTAESTPVEPSSLRFNPYPSSIHQKVISPSGTRTVTPIAQPRENTSQKQAQAPSPEAVSPDIMRLATNKDLSISTIAREAQRLREKSDEEVVISLR